MRQKVIKIKRLQWFPSVPSHKAWNVCVPFHLLQRRAVLTNYMTHTHFLLSPVEPRPGLNFYTLNFMGGHRVRWTEVALMGADIKL